MDEQSQNSNPPRTGGPEPTNSTPRLEHRTVLPQPSESFLREMEVVKAKEAEKVSRAPVTSQQEVVPTQTSSAELPPHPPGSANSLPTNSNQPIPKQAEGEYNPASKKVSERAPLLKLYAIVMLILSAIGFLSALRVAATIGHVSLVASTSNLIKNVTYVLPLIAGIIFLSSRSLVLVKALLFVILIDYIVNLVTIFSFILTPHAGISISGSFLVSAIIPVIFMVWTWSVYSEVGLLSE